MSTLKELIKFINVSGDNENPWGEEEWEKELTKSILDWRSIVKDVSSWEKLDTIRPKGKYYNGLCIVVIGVAGVGLAKRWFNSSVYDQKQAAEKWVEHNGEFWDDFTDEMRIKAIGSYRFFQRFHFKVWPTLTKPMKEILIRNNFEGFFKVLNVNYWNGLDDDLKIEFLVNVFKKYKGEPLETIEEYMQSIDYLHYKLNNVYGSGNYVEFDKMFPPPPHLSSYIPAPEINKVRFIIQDANDKKSLDKINEMISQREKACQNISGSGFYAKQQIPYNPNSDERELIARLMEKAIRNGYLPAALPTIYISSKTPPIFIAYPELEEGEEDSSDGIYKRQIPRKQDRIRPEIISIEELLGVYQPQQQKIIIYEKGIKWSSKRIGFDKEWLLSVVLIHEISHWVTHMLPKPGIPSWPTEMYILSEPEVLKGLAQLMTWWIANEVGGVFECTFEKLNQTQPTSYQVFKNFTDKPVDKVIESIEKLRLLPRPARLQDWKRMMG
jgi:hypothetical protein